MSGRFLGIDSSIFPSSEALRVLNASLDSCMLFWALKPSDCAAWVQAWGSVGALAVGVGVVAWQLGHRSKELERLRRDEVRRWRAIALAVHTAAKLRLELELAAVISLRGPKSANDTFRRAAAVLTDVRASDLVNAELMSAVLAARELVVTMCAELDATNDAYFSDSEAVRWEQRLVSLGEIVNHLRRLSDDVREGREGEK